MTQETTDRVALLEEAKAIEAGGGEWGVRHVMAVLGIGRSSVYDTPWLRRIAKKAGKRGLRFDPAEVRARGKRPATRTGT